MGRAGPGPGIDGEEFTVISHSLTGINFTLEVRGGDLARFCSPAGTGACPAGGNW